MNKIVNAVKKAVAKKVAPKKEPVVMAMGFTAGCSNCGNSGMSCLVCREGRDDVVESVV